MISPGMINIFVFPVQLYVGKQDKNYHYITVFREDLSIASRENKKYCARFYARIFIPWEGGNLVGGWRWFIFYFLADKYPGKENLGGIL